MNSRKVVKTTRPLASHLFSVSWNFKAKRMQYQVEMTASGVRIRKHTKSLKRFLLSLNVSGRNSHFRKWNTILLDLTKKSVLLKIGVPG
jgi:hypothetical protein